MDTVEIHNVRVAILCDGEQVGVGTLRVSVIPGERIVEETLVDSRVRPELPDPSQHRFELQFFDIMDAVAWQAVRTPECIGRDG